MTLFSEPQKLQCYEDRGVGVDVNYYYILSEGPAPNSAYDVQHPGFGSPGACGCALQVAQRRRGHIKEAIGRLGTSSASRTRSLQLDIETNASTSHILSSYLLSSLRLFCSPYYVGRRRYCPPPGFRSRRRGTGEGLD